MDDRNVWIFGFMCGMSFTSTLFMIAFIIKKLLLR